MGSIKFNQFFKKLFIYSIVGTIAGVSSAFFLNVLNSATSFRESHSWPLYFLPFAGFIVSYMYNVWGKDSGKGNNLILEEIHSPKNKVPLRMAPFVFIGTIVTHLFGGSAGREGTAVQMGGSFADQFASYLNVNQKERKKMLMAGSGAALGAAIGSPLAGIIFGMEVISIGNLRLLALGECIIASIFATFASHIIGLGHSHYPKIILPEINANLIIIIIISGIIFGIVAASFARFTHFVENIFKKYISYPPIRSFTGGIILIVLFNILGHKYIGLGLDSISSSFYVASGPYDWFFKFVLTSITLSAGFKGGEFTPLVFIGATLGSFIGISFELPITLFAALGFVSVFAGASNAPISCILMGIDVFGIGVAPFLILSCYVSYYFSGHRGIYSSQLVHTKKHKRISNAFIKLCR